MAKLPEAAIRRDLIGRWGPRPITDINRRDIGENLLLEAIKALSAEEICADTLENIPLMLAASGWRSTAALLTHAAGYADAGDFLNAERNRQRGREQFIEANDAFRQFMEARSVEARAKAFAEAFQCP